MSNAIYSKIGKILIITAPHDSKKIITKIEIAEENDVGIYTFSAIDASGKEKSYRPVSQARDDLFEAMLELKQYTLNNNLTNGKPIWVGCIVIVDIKNSKINIDFKYEPSIEN